MAFLTEEDLSSSIYDEILDAISRQNPQFIKDNINRTITEVDARLRTKYVTTDLWTQTGDDRDETILGICIDICLYHIHSVLEEVPIIRRERHDYAQQSLKDLTKINATMLLHSIPLITDDADTGEANEISYGSNSSRW